MFAEQVLEWVLECGSAFCKYCNRLLGWRAPERVLDQVPLQVSQWGPAQSQSDTLKSCRHLDFHKFQELSVHNIVLPVCLSKYFVLLISCIGAFQEIIIIFEVLHV